MRTPLDVRGLGARGPGARFSASIPLLAAPTLELWQRLPPAFPAPFLASFSQQAEINLWSSAGPLMLSELYPLHAGGCEVTVFPTHEFCTLIIVRWTAKLVFSCHCP